MDYSHTATMKSSESQESDGDRAGWNLWQPKGESSSNIALCASHGQPKAHIRSWLDLVARIGAGRMRCCLDHSQVKNMCCQVRTIGGQQAIASSA